MGRIVAIDFGKKRTGIAVTDPMQIIASGLTTVETNKLMPFLQQYVKDEEVDCLVVGDPRQMNNEASESKVLIDEFLVKLKKTLPKLSIKMVDERFTSKMASHSLVMGGVKKKDRQNKALIDEVSATLILQSYLDQIR